MRKVFSVYFIFLICLIFSFDAKAYDNSVDINVDAIPNNEGEVIEASVSSKRDIVTITIQLMNSGEKDAVIKPGSIYLHSAALSDYQCILSLGKPEDPHFQDENTTINQGDSFTLKPNTLAILTLELAVDISEANAPASELSWVFSINNRSIVYNGEVNFMKGGPLPTTSKSVQNDTTPLKLFSIGAPELPDVLPATGFPVNKHRRTASVQPESLAYEELNGLRLEIPVINADIEMVRVPLNEQKEWAVEWLTDQAGILSSSALPGQGTSIIAAHNSLDAVNRGPFLLLFQLQNNDRLFVTDNDGTFLLYSVYANDLVSPTDSEIIYEKAKPGSLVLLTCESELPEGGYAHRRVVYAEPLQ